MFFYLATISLAFCQAPPAPTPALEVDRLARCRAVAGQFRSTCREGQMEWGNDTTSERTRCECENGSCEVVKVLCVSCY